MTSQPTSTSEDEDELECKEDETLEFPPFYPPGCPPGDAEQLPEEGITAFRIVSNNPPKDEDFKDHVEKKLRTKDPTCLRRALSTYEDLEGAVGCARRFPWIGDKIAIATLLPQHGAYRWSPNGFSPRHMSWWRAKDVIGPEFFVHHSTVTPRT